MIKPLRTTPVPPPAPTHLRTTLTASLAFTPRRTHRSRLHLVRAIPHGVRYRAPCGQ
jgi:hypothetical protein